MLEIKGTDPSYEALRVPSNSYARECREAFLRLWSIAHPYLDDDLTQRAASSMQAAFWEIHVAAALLEAGASVVPRDQRTPKRMGPDLFCASPRVWVEATAVTPGTGADAVPEGELGVARSVPDDQILLRIVQAIEEKKRRWKAYLERGWVGEADPYIVAVNSGVLPSGKAELQLPRIVRAVFAVGHRTVSLDRRSGRATDEYYQFRPEIVKKSGASVSVALFEDDTSREVSACLYSITDAFNPPRSLIGSMVLVHNPHANAPLERGKFPGVQEYWADGEFLVCPGNRA